MRNELRENKFKRALIAGTPQIGLWMSLDVPGCNRGRGRRRI